MLSKESIEPYTTNTSDGVCESFHMTWTEMEIKYALQRNKRLILLSIDGTKPRDCDWLAFRLGGSDYVNYAKEESRQKFIRNLHDWAVSGSKESIIINSSTKDIHKVKATPGFKIKNVGTIIVILGTIVAFLIYSNQPSTSILLNSFDCSLDQMAELTDGVHDYIGAINEKYSIHMCLEKTGQSISGTYYYDKFHEKEPAKHMNVIGTVSGDSVFLKEYNLINTYQGTFIGQISNDRASDKKIMLFKLLKDNTSH